MYPQQQVYPQHAPPMVGIPMVGSPMMGMPGMSGPAVREVADDLSEGAPQVICAGILSCVPCCHATSAPCLIYLGYKMRTELSSKHTFRQQMKSLGKVKWWIKVTVLCYVATSLYTTAAIIRNVFNLYETVGTMRLGVDDKIAWSTALNNVQYRVFPLLSMTYEEAAGFCQAEGTGLAVLDTSEKMAFVNSYIAEQYRIGEHGGGNCVGEFWMGLKSTFTSDLRESGSNPKWKWSDGSWHTVSDFEVWHRRNSFSWMEHLKTVGGVYTFPDGKSVNVTKDMEITDLAYKANGYCGVYSTDTTIFHEQSACKSGFSSTKSLAETAWRNRECDLKRNFICERISSEEKGTIYTGVKVKNETDDLGSCGSRGGCDSDLPELITGVLEDALTVSFGDSTTTISRVTDNGLVSRNNYRQGRRGQCFGHEGSTVNKDSLLDKKVSVLSCSGRRERGGNSRSTSRFLWRFDDESFHLRPVDDENTVLSIGWLGSSMANMMPDAGSYVFLGAKENPEPTSFPLVFPEGEGKFSERMNPRQKSLLIQNILRLVCAVLLIILLVMILQHIEEFLVELAEVAKISGTAEVSNDFMNGFAQGMQSQQQQMGFQGFQQQGFQQQQMGFQSPQQQMGFQPPQQQMGFQQQTQPQRMEYAQKPVQGFTQQPTQAYEQQHPQTYQEEP